MPNVPKVGRRAHSGLVALVVIGAIAAPLRSGDASDTSTILGSVSHALADPGAPSARNVAVSGSVFGSGSSGSFRTWTSDDRERTEQVLGARVQRTLRLGDRRWIADENGFVRELTGTLARRERTQQFIDGGAFVEHPERCALRGYGRVDGRTTLDLDVAAPGGDVERVAFDPRTWLPARIAYDDDDGRSTITLGDWRTVAGRRYPFSAVASNGDRAFDVTQTTTSIDTSPIDPSVFAPLAARASLVSEQETIPLVEREGHLFAPVTIADRTYEFLIDSGTQDIVLDRHVAGELGLAAGGAFEASGARRTGGVALASVPGLQVGARERLGPLVVASFDLGGMLHGRRVDGILGYPFFASAEVRLDAAAKSMTVGAPGSFTPSGTRLPVDLDRALVETNVRLGGALDAPLLVDTGNAAELLLYRPFARAHPGLVAYTARLRRAYGVGGHTASYRTSLGRLDVADVSFYNVDTDVMLATSGAYADRTDAGNLGLGVLRNLIVTFDVANAALYVDRGREYDDGRSRN